MSSPGALNPPTWESRACTPYPFHGNRQNRMDTLVNRHDPWQYRHHGSTNEHLMLFSCPPYLANATGHNTHVLHVCQPLLTMPVRAQTSVSMHANLRPCLGIIRKHCTVAALQAGQNRMHPGEASQHRTTTHKRDSAHAS